MRLSYSQTKPIFVHFYVSQHSEALLLSVATRSRVYSVTLYLSAPEPQPRRLRLLSSLLPTRSVGGAVNQSKLDSLLFKPRQAIRLYNLGCLTPE